MRQEDLSGKRFGLLTAHSKSSVDKHGRVIWECVCACGGRKLVHSGNLKHVNVRSCGCGRRGPLPMKVQT